MAYSYAFHKSLIISIPIKNYYEKNCFKIPFLGALSTEVWLKASLCIKMIGTLQSFEQESSDLQGGEDVRN